MSFCPNCGKELNGEFSFCPNCGTQINTTNPSANTNMPNSATLIFKRDKAFICCGVKVDVKIDGEKHGSIKNGNELNVYNIPFGEHKIELKAGSNSSTFYTIDIKNNNPIITLPVYFKSYFACIEDDNIPEISEPKKKFNFLAILLGIIGGIVLGIILIGIFASLSTDDDTENNSADVSSDTDIENQVQFTQIDGTVGNWQVSITDYEFTDAVSLGLLTQYSSEENSEYCLISVSVKNIGNESDVFLPYFSLGYDSVAKIQWNGYEYTPTSMPFVDSNLCSESLNPLVETSGKIAFEIPKEVIESDLPMTFVLAASGQTLSCQLVKN